MNSNEVSPVKKTLLLLVSTLLLAFATTASAADDSWNLVRTAGKLVIGLDDTFPPMGYRDAGGKLIGFDIDTATAVGKRLGVKIEWRPIPWDRMITALQTKQIDAIWNGMTITPERAKAVAFTRPYFMDGQVAMVRSREKRFKKLGDLQQVKVGIRKGSAALDAVKQLAVVPVELKEYANNPEALAELDAGSIDAVVLDKVAGRTYLVTRPGQFRILPGLLSKGSFGVAFRQEDRELLEKVQQTIDAMVKDGAMAHISNKWFGVDITNPQKWQAGQ